MRWWLRCRASVPAALILVASTALMVRFGLASMPAPRITVGIAPYFILFPAFVASALISVVHRGHHLAEARSSRPLSLLSFVGLHVLLVAVCCTWAALLRPAWGDPLALQAIRSVIGYSGAALLAYRCIGGRSAAAVPILYAMLVGTFGRDAGSVVWFPLLSADRFDAWCLVGALWFVGVAVTVGRRALVVQWEREAGADADPT